MTATQLIATVAIGWIGTVSLVLWWLHGATSKPTPKQTRPALQAVRDDE